jgi:hypothetical protein
MGVIRLVGKGGLMTARTLDEPDVDSPRSPTGQRFLLVAEIARLANPDPKVVSPNLLYRLIQNDQLPAIKIGGRRKYVIPAQALSLVLARVLREGPSPTVTQVGDQASTESVRPQGPLVLSVAQAARLLRVCRATIERAYLADQFPVLRWNKRVTVPMRAIDEMEAAALASGGLDKSCRPSRISCSTTASVAARCALRADCSANNAWCTRSMRGGRSSGDGRNSKAERGQGNRRPRSCWTRGRRTHYQRSAKWSRRPRQSPDCC